MYVSVYLVLTVFTIILNANNFMYLRMYKCFLHCICITLFMTLKKAQVL